MKDRSADVEQEQSARANKTDASKSTSKQSVPESGGENEEEKLQQEADKSSAKIHYYSRTIAREHGINAATVLGGFAFKLKHHKLNWWKDRYWYYETFEMLCERRWPYFSPAGLCGIVAYLSDEAGLLIKNSNNKKSYDGTNWYAIDNDVRNAALADSIWFDVRVAKMDKLGIPGATIYHNLRFHLRELLQNDPGFGVPYHELNKRQLARDLPMDYSTVKRKVKELIKAKLIKAHPTRKKWFTLADLSELGMDTTNGSSANENGSSANRNGSNANGSDSNRNGSSANTSGSSANENGSESNDYTQSETHKKACQKPIRKPADVGCEDSLSGKDNGISSEGTKTSSSDFSEQDSSTATNSFKPVFTKFSKFWRTIGNWCDHPRSPISFPPIWRRDAHGSLANSLPTRF